jgi:glycosyltransferase involved in cell wall biosynthesis
MKIVLVSPSYPFKGGISHYSALLFRHLALRHSVVWVSYRRMYPRRLFPGKMDRDESRFFPAGDPKRLPLLDSLNPLTWVRAASRILGESPDLVIFPWWVSYWAPLYLTLILILKRRSRARVLFLCHNVIEHESGRLKKWLTRAVLSRGDYFIVHSAREKEILHRLAGPAAVIDTPHPSYGAFNTESLSKAEAKKRIGVDDKRIVLFFGFVRRYKGLTYLLRSMPAVMREVPLKLLVVGEFWEDERPYRELIRKLGLDEHVSLVDRYVRNEEIPAYFRAADLVVLPYTSVTGSGLVQLAFGFNKPVVATRLGALAEAVKDGQTGFLVPPRDPRAIARAVIAFFRRGESRKMAACIKKDGARFSWDRLVEAIETLSGRTREGKGRDRASWPSSLPGKRARTCSSGKPRGARGT